MGHPDVFPKEDLPVRVDAVLIAQAAVDGLGSHRPERPLPVDVERTQKRDTGSDRVVRDRSSKKGPPSDELNV